MNNRCIFTICSKNYLAQALTLKESVSIHEQYCDFYIFLADQVTESIKEVEVEVLDESWIPDWKEMAFKYDVIEFNTSIKPFCFKKLFDKGYDKVIYLDPDIYVTERLDYIWDNLDKKSIILTPHVNNIEDMYSGATPETSLLFVGIYNLGFGAIRNNSVGNSIVSWWCKRLYEKCYADLFNSLHVDQKWMDFIPGFFPEEVLISHHFGMNVAVWNLHERELLIKEGKYFIKDLRTNSSYPLLFFHFSGFDPFNDKVINRRHPKFGVEHFPSFGPIIEEYKKLEYKNGYEKYSKLKYSFNEYSNGYVILPLHRRLYRATISEFGSNRDPFSSESPYYNNLRKSGLILSEYNVNARFKYAKVVGAKRSRYVFIINGLFKIAKKLLGIKRYTHLITHLEMLCRMENQTFLMRKMETINRDTMFTVRQNN